MVRRVLVAVLTLLGVVLGYAALDIADIAPGLLTTKPVAAPRPAPTPGGATTLGWQLADPTAPLDAVATAAPQPAPKKLAALLAPLAGSGALGSTSVVVRDALTGTVLLDRDGATPRIPASTVKLLTAAAIESTTTPTTTFLTTVVDGPGPGHITLVAGGDTLLAPGSGDPDAVAGRAGLKDLAAQVAAALKAAGRTSVVLGLDLSFGRGPATAPTWPSAYRPQGTTSAVAMLGLATQRATLAHPGPADPPAQALAAFATALQAAGVTVKVAGSAAPPAPGQEVLGSVASAPVREQLGLALLESDNGLTESLARAAAARAGAKTDFAGAAAWVRATVGGLGVDVTAVRLVDTSGLSRENQVPARVISDVIQLGADGSQPGVAQALTDLPVAGLSGTLAERFSASAAAAAIGAVRAKTGTLTGVQGLAGTVLTADGRVLTLVVLAEGSAPGQGTVSARAVLDRIAATLAACGCR